MESVGALSIPALIGCKIRETSGPDSHAFGGDDSEGDLPHLAFGLQAGIVFMSSPSPAPRASRSNKWAARITIAGLSVLVLLAVLAFVTITLGHVYGEEIASETFQRRKFNYFQLFNPTDPQSDKFNPLLEARPVRV